MKPKIKVEKLLVIKYITSNSLGTGVLGARDAVEYSKGMLDIDQKIFIESITGAIFSVSVKNAVPVGDYEGIVPEVGGDASIIGKSTFWIDPNDPLKNGFLLK